MLLERFRMDHKVAVVTGAGRGIGAGIARGFAEAGATVVCAARTERQVEILAREIEDEGGHAIAVPCDVMVRDDLDTLVSHTIETYGRVDVLVNNAGGGPYKPALRTGERSLEETLHFNVTAPFVLTRLCAPHMVEHGGGTVLNITSAMGRIVGRGFVAYGTAKAALDHMTELLADELAPKIRVNALALGSIETSALAPFVEDGDLRQKMESLTPLGRIGTVEDVALAAIWLCSDAGSYVTGKIVEVDGGLTKSNWPYTLDDI